MRLSPSATASRSASVLTNAVLYMSDTLFKAAGSSLPNCAMSVALMSFSAVSSASTSPDKVFTTPAVLAATPGESSSQAAHRSMKWSDTAPSNALRQMRRRTLSGGIGISSTTSNRRIRAGSMDSVELQAQIVGTGAVSSVLLSSALLVRAVVAMPKTEMSPALQTSSASSSRSIV